MSLTCRSGNERTSRPSASEKPTPILIQIPLQQPSRGGQLQLPRPENPIMPGPMGPPIPQNFPMQRPLQPQQPPLPLQPQQRPNIIPQQQQHHQQQQQPQPASSHQHQLNFHGPIPLHPQPPPMIPEQPQHRLLNPFQQLRLPFIPIPQFPQIPLREVIPHLLEVHKQIQQQRREEEQQQQQQQQRREQQQRHQEHGKVEQRLEQDDSDQKEPQHESQESLVHRGPQGRAMPIHDIPLQRIALPPNPFMQPPPHLNNPIHQGQQNLVLHPEPIIGHPNDKHHMERQPQPPPLQQQQQQHPSQLRHPQPPPQQQQQQHSQEDDHEHRHGDPEMHLEVGATFHNGPQPVPNDMLMERAGPVPFIVGSHSKLN